MGMDLTIILYSSFEKLWLSFIAWGPNFIAALVVFVLGLSASSVFGRLIEQFMDAMKVDSVIEKMGAKPYFDRAGLRIDSGRLIGQLVFWFLALAFLLAATDILGLQQVSNALRSLLGFVPNVIVAALVILAAVLLSNFLSRVVRSAATGAKLEASSFVAAIVKWAVLLFGLLAALNQLQIAQNIINIFVTGIVAMLAIAGGLAFGLGGRQFAEDLLAKLKKEMEE